MAENRRILWEIQRQQVRIDHDGDKADLVGWLAEGWEPFAATWDGDSFDYHLRRWFFEASDIDGTTDGINKSTAAQFAGSATNEPTTATEPQIR